jgi:hypothetical protein
MSRAETFFREGREEHEEIHKDFGVRCAARQVWPAFRSDQFFLRVSSRPSRIALGFPG